MIIELRGLGFVNKGAELMLHAIIQKVRSEFPDALFVMEKSHRTSIKKFDELALFKKLKYKRYIFDIDLSIPGTLIPKSIRRKNNYILESEVDIVLDGSGFAFGDKWGADYASARLANHIEKWHRQKKIIILLPQAFGPFSDRKLVDKMKIIVENADLVFARDPQSYEFIKNVSANNSNIKLSPDFTNLVEGIVPDDFDSNKLQIAIIPNFKMLEENSLEAKNSYLEFLKNAILHVRELGYNPFFLIHEGQKDKKIADDVNNMLEQAAFVLIEDHPLKVKGIIGASKAVITSRFHGLVSALSQCVPCLSTSWSHKYEMLLEDYNYKEGIVDVTLKSDDLKERIKKLLDEENYEAIKKTLKENSDIQKQNVKKLWDMIFKLI